jgi:LysM domain
MSTKQSRKLARTFAVVSLLVVTGAAFAAVGNASENGPRDPHAGMVQVVVGGGETLWDIASMVSGNQSVQSVVNEIADANHMTSPDVQAGERLWVPAK